MISFTPSKMNASLQRLQPAHFLVRKPPPFSGRQIAEGELSLSDADEAFHLQPDGGAHVPDLPVFSLADGQLQTAASAGIPEDPDLSARVSHALICDRSGQQRRFPSGLFPLTETRYVFLTP